jgi:GNAT superfamily N-acetyltransferase
MRIRTMTRADLDAAVDLAAAEGWNPGLHDADAFRAADPDGFFVADLDGQSIGCISAVSYEGGFGFIGLYIVSPPYRGHGVGMQLWNAAMARLGGHNVGLDGVLAQQDNYRRSGFTSAYRNIRFERTGSAVAAEEGSVDLRTVPFEKLCDYDRRAFPAPRPAFLRSWIDRPGTRALARYDGVTIRGYGVIRPCRTGFKIGPLFADTGEDADALYRGLVSTVPSGTAVYLDVPEVNEAAMALARRQAMRRVFETARMYTGRAPDVALDHVFGVTTFELG